MRGREVTMTRRGREQLRKLPSWALALAFVIASCTPAGEPSRAPEGGQAPAPVERRIKSLTIVEDSEPQIVVTGMGFRIAKPLRNSVHHHLAIYDNRGEV